MTEREMLERAAPLLAQLQRLLDRRWIACSERCPPYDEDLKVLAFTEGHDYGGVRFHHMKATDFYEYDPDGEGEPGTALARTVTHWMPEPWPPGDCAAAAMAEKESTQEPRESEHG